MEMLRSLIFLLVLVVFAIAIATQQFAVRDRKVLRAAACGEQSAAASLMDEWCISVIGGGQ